MKTNTFHAKKVLVALFAVLLPLVASAEKVEIDGIWYNLVSKAKQAEVTYKEYSYGNYYNEYSGSITIPATVTHNGTQYSVTSIGGYAFYKCSSLTFITIPEGVTSIGMDAFYGCSSLTAINIPENSKLTSIGSEAFQYCSSLSSVTIGSNVTTIGKEAFYNTSLKKVIWLTNTPPSGYTEVKSAVNYVPNNQYTKLSNCVVYPYLSSRFTTNGVVYVPNPTNMTCDVISCTYNDRINTDIKIDSMVVYRGVNFKVDEVVPYAFYKNTNINSVTIGNGINNIGEQAFYECKKLKTVAIGDGLKSLGSKAFYGCDALKSFEVGRDIETIGENAFYGCSSIESFTCYAKQPPVCGSMAIDDIDKWNCTLKVPSKAVDRYKNADQWAGFFFTEGFEVAPNKVTFMIEDTLHETINVEYGEEIPLPSSPEKEGHTFEWIDVPTIMPSNDIVINGTFTKNKYKVQFVVDDKVQYSDSILYGESITLIEEPTKEGYTFSGWSEAPATMPAEDVTISGTFTINKYLVTFKIDDEVITSDSLEYGANIVAPEAPEKEGYTFNGWGNVAWKVPAHDLTYEGTYKVNSYTLRYVVNDMSYKTVSVRYGDTITLIDEPTKEGYEFSGWSEVPETMPAKDVTISGTFIINKYLVTFKIGDEVIASDSLEYMSAIVAPEAPEKEGHTFNGWGEIAEIVPANDLTYEGSYSVNSYTLTYTVDGDVYKKVSVNYGETITPTAEPTKEGYAFSGWSEIPETMPAKDIIVTGTFTRLSPVYLTIQQADNGRIKHIMYEGTVVRYQIEASEGWKVNTVTFNGEDVSEQLEEGNIFTSPEMYEDGVLNISFEKIDDSIENTRANAVKVSGHNGIISICGAAEGEAITIYTLDGAMVANATATTETTSIEVPTQQVYIVKVADKVVKIGM